MSRDAREVVRSSLDALAELIRHHQASVCAAAYGVTGDRALSEDVAQETFLAAWRGRSVLRDPARQRAWLCAIARNLARKALRRRDRVADAVELSATDDVAGDAIARDEARATWIALRALPDRYREALVLYYWEDQSARQVADALGITEAAALQRLSRGRALLRGELAQQVDRTLGRARRKAALTAAILAAVAATVAETTPAAAGARPSAIVHRISRRAIWQGSLGLGALGVVRKLGGSGGSSTERPRGPEPRATGSTVTASAPADRSPDASRATHEPQVEAVSRGGEPALDDDPCPYEMLTLTSDAAPAGWVTGEMHAAMSAAYIPQLIDRSCQIEVEIRDGKIARSVVLPFDGASDRLVASPLYDEAVSLPRTELRRWITADKLLRVVPEPAVRVDRDRTIEAGALIALYAEARLAGLAVAGPDGVRRLALTWGQVAPRPVDRDAYRELEVGAGASRGPANAPVTIVSFLDLADAPGHSAKAIAALRELRAQYPDDVRVVVKLCPLSCEGELAAQAVHAAGAQGAFWPMFDRVAARSAPPGLDDVLADAAALRLDAGRLRAELARRTFGAAVALDQDQMAAMDIDALPSALVQFTRVHGAASYDTFADAVERVLHATRDGTAR